MDPTVGRIVHYRPLPEGDAVPLIIVRIEPDQTVSGHVFLDGWETQHVSGVREGTEPGTWSWPPRVESIPATGQ